MRFRILLWTLLTYARLFAQAPESVWVAGGGGWTSWTAARDPHRESVLDLRALNENVAGENGRIVVREERFVRERDGRAVRFWGVNGPADNLSGDELRHALRDLAKRGVNLIRVHGTVFDKGNGTLDSARVDRLLEIAHFAKQEGIYTHFSIYFPLWFTPNAELPILQGYNGSQHPFASIFFNEAFEKTYQSWWREILTRRGPDGQNLLNDPAVFGVELINEDSLFFWTFAERNLPDAQWRILEGLFYDWALQKHGSPESVARAWNNQRVSRDNVAEQRYGFIPLYDIFTHKTVRARETTEFLARTQRAFYDRQVLFLRGLGFKGLITASNWHTASDQFFKPLEHWTYLAGDFIDRHGYFGARAEGEHVAWSIRPGQTHASRSALRFEAGDSGKRDFSHPVADVKINGRPSMISETTWTRPNRYRGEAPLFYAVYGALQGSDSIVHFAHDGPGWNVKPRFWMQPWTLMSPTQMGQFPAAALIYRLGYVQEGEVMASVGLELQDLFDLKGTPLVQKGNLDELRLADVSGEASLQQGQVIDPRIHFVGRTRVHIGENAPPTRLLPLDKHILDAQNLIRSSSGELELDYGRGILRVNAPRAQALSGDLRSAGKTRLAVLGVDSSMELATVILVSLDGEPLQSSARMLLQVMTEEQPSGWQTRPAANGRFTIENIGRDPWQFRSPEGRVVLHRPDAASLTVTALDFNGYPTENLGAADSILLRPDTVYYLISR